MLCDHRRSRCAGIVLSLPLWVRQRTLEAITGGDDEGVGGEDEGQLHHQFWTLLKGSLGAGNPNVDIAGSPAKAWLIWEHCTAGSDIHSLLIMTVSLINNIDFPLLIAQTLEYLCFHSMFPSVPGTKWADSLRKLCGTLLVSRGTSSSVIRLPPFTSFWFQTMLLQACSEANQPFNHTQRDCCLPKEKEVRFVNFLGKKRYNYQPLVARPPPTKGWTVTFLKGFPEPFLLGKNIPKGRKKKPLHNISSMESFCWIMHFLFW